MSNSRLENAFKNSAITVICQVLFLLTGLIGRTVLTKLLGSEYLGINGLFSNILTILSFAELGIGNTLVYRMYKPLAEGDEDKIAAYIDLFKKIYRVIIAVIIVLGIGIIPFLKYIVEAPNIKESLLTLYLFYLLDTVISYAYVYKKSLLIADQKSYVVAIYTQTFNIVMNVLQCAALILTRSFILYFAIRIACNLFNNILCSAHAQRYYPYISKRNIKKIDKDEITGLKTDVKGMLLTKVASTAFSGTDNIFISKFIGIAYVGILSNYTMILGTINSVMNSIFGSITASIGNLYISNNISQTEKVLERLFFINTSLYGYICVGMLLLLQEFVTEIWLTNEYYLPFGVVLASVVELFYRSIHYPLHTVRNALGLFSQGRILYLMLAVLNIVLDALLVMPLGIVGLILATIVCRGGTYAVDIYAVYKYGFKKSPVKYVRGIVLWTLFIGMETLLSHFFIEFIRVDGVIGFALKIMVISFVYMISYLVLFRKSNDYLYFRNMTINRIKSKLEGRRRG